MKKISLKNVGSAAAMAAMLAGAMVMSGCEGGSSGAVEGGSTVQGHVESVSGNAAVGLVLRAGATGPIGGVQVRVDGTDLAATTASDGLFVISGVPPGDQQLVFTAGGTEAMVSIHVPANATVQIGRVDISDTRAEISNIRVEQHAPSTSNGNSSSNENSNASNDSNDNDSMDDSADGDSNSNDSNSNDSTSGDSNSNDSSNSVSNSTS